MSPLTRRRALQLGAITAGALAIQHATRALPGAHAMRLPPTLRVGTATLDVTPPAAAFPSMWLNGFAYRGNTPADGVSMPLVARALAINDALGSHARVIVSVPVLGIPRALHQAIATDVASRYSLPNDSLLLAASHTHSGPVLTDNLAPGITFGLSTADLQIVDQYTAWFRQRLVDLVGQALSAQTNSSQDVSMSYGARDLAGSGLEFAANRAGLPYADHTLSVLAFRRTSDNTLAAVVFTYACHPVYLLGSKYHPDWPGVAAANIEANNPGAAALFIQGCAGDINPSANVGTFAPSFGTGSYSVVDPPGRNIATAVQSVLGGSMQALDSAINSSYQEVSLPLNVNQPDSMGQIVTPARLLSIYQNIKTQSQPGDVYYRHTDQMISQLQSGTSPQAVPLPLALWQLGSTKPLMLLAMGGEGVTDYTLVLRKLYPAVRLWVAAYANEVPSYIPSDEMLTGDCACAGYERGWATQRFAPSPPADNGADVTRSVADQSMMYYGWPAPYQAGAQSPQALVTAGMMRLIPVTPQQAGTTIYAIQADGTLQWYKHLGYTDGSASWSGPVTVGTGWQNFLGVFPRLPEPNGAP